MTIIVLEGLDGSGKTTLAHALADTIGYQYRHYPVDLERQKANIPASYGTDYMMMRDMLDNPPDPLTDWVLDRYVPSHKAYGGRFGWNLSTMPLADLSFLIQVDPQVSLDRCRLRGNDTDITLAQRIEIAQRYSEMQWTATIPSECSVAQSVKFIRGFL